MFNWSASHSGVVDPRLLEGVFGELGSAREQRLFLRAAFPEPTLLACASLESFVRSGRLGLRAEGIVAVLGGGVLAAGDAELHPVGEDSTDLYLTGREELETILPADPTVRRCVVRPELAATPREGGLLFARLARGAVGAESRLDPFFWPRLARVDSDPRSRDCARSLRELSAPLSPAARLLLARSVAVPWEALWPSLLDECERLGLWQAPLASMEEIDDGALCRHVLRCLEPLRADGFPGALRGGALRWLGPIEPARRTMSEDEEHVLFHAPELGRPGEAWLAVIVKGSGAAPARVRAEPGARICEVFADRPAVIAPWSPEGEDLRVHLRGARIVRAGIYVQASE